MLGCRATLLFRVLPVLCLLAGCSDSNGSSGLSSGNTSATATTSDGGVSFKTFDDALKAEIAKYNATDAGMAQPIRGASAVVVHKDKGLLYSKGYGDFAADRVYLIASSSKILSVGVLMKLQDEGKLDINTPISEYLGSDWGDHKPEVTLAQLFSNSSGLPALGEILALSSNPTAALLQQYGPHLCQYMAAGSLSDCGKSIYQDDNPDNNRKPDETFRYGGSQWQLGGAVAEVVSGKSWSQLIQETYVEPCEVPTLGFTNPYGQPGVSPLGYPGFGADPSNLPSSENPSIEGGGYITAPDYAKLLLMHLRGGKCGDNEVLSPEAVETMQTDRVAAYGGKPTLGSGDESPYNGYGLAWWIDDQTVVDPGAYGAFPFLDRKREYGAMIMFEANNTIGGKIGFAVKPVLDSIIDKLK